MESPKKEFENLLTEILVKIDAIDKATPYTHVEPGWWVEMSVLRRQILHIQNSIYPRN